MPKVSFGDKFYIKFVITHCNGYFAKLYIVLLCLYIGLSKYNLRQIISVIPSACHRSNMDCTISSRSCLLSLVGLPTTEEKVKETLIYIFQGSYLQVNIIPQNCQYTLMIFLHIITFFLFMHIKYDHSSEKRNGHILHFDFVTNTLLNILNLKFIIRRYKFGCSLIHAV